MKQLCKLKSNMPDNILEVISLVENPKFICLKCGRVSSKKDALCKPDKIEKYKKKKEKG